MEINDASISRVYCLMIGVEEMSPHLPPSGFWEWRTSESGYVAVIGEGIPCKPYMIFEFIE